MEAAVFLVVIALVAIAVPVLVYNSLVGKRNQADNAASSIDVYLKQRFDLIPNLVATVQAYMKHERETLTQLTEIRARAMAGDQSLSDKTATDAQVTRLLGSIRVAAENYPELKASQNFVQLLGSMNEVEEKIAAARRNYNGSVTDYNNGLQMFPGNLMAGPMGFKARPLFEIPEAERQSPNVKQLFAT